MTALATWPVQLAGIARKTHPQIHRRATGKASHRHAVQRVTDLGTKYVQSANLPSVKVMVTTVFNSFVIRITRTEGVLLDIPRIQYYKETEIVSTLPCIGACFHCAAVGRTAALPHHTANVRRLVPVPVLVYRCVTRARVEPAPPAPASERPQPAARAIWRRVSLHAAGGARLAGRGDAGSGSVVIVAGEQNHGPRR